MATTYSQGQSPFQMGFTQNTQLPSYLPYAAGALGVAAGGGGPEEMLSPAGGIVGTALGGPVGGLIGSSLGAGIGQSVQDMRAAEDAYDFVSSNPGMYYQGGGSPYVRPEDPTMALARMKEDIGANDKFNLKAQKKYAELAADVQDNYEAGMERYRNTKWKEGAERKAANDRARRYSRAPIMTSSIYQYM